MPVKSCLISYITCLVYVPYLGKLQDPKTHEFSLKLLISPMIGTSEVKRETVINGKILIMRKSTGQ